jgi:hypothetical protein
MKKNLITTFMCLSLLVLPTLACSLSESAAPTPTQQPAPTISSPVVGLNPITGAPGTVIRVGAAGFPTGAKVNLFLTPVDVTTPNQVAQDLTIGAGGLLVFAMQLPDKLGDKTISGTMPLNFMIVTTDSTVRASAVFLATSGSATVAPTSDDTGDNSGGTSGGGTGGGTLFITSPSIGSAVAGGAVVVTGSGSAANNRVGVQVQDANNKVLGSAIAVIQAGAGAVGPWQITVTFTQPTAAAAGYIVAYTVNSQGGVAQQSSIPITMMGGAAPVPTTALPGASATVAPSVPPVITGIPPGFITATPKP